MKIGGRTISVKCRNIELLTGGKSSEVLPIAQRAEYYLEYVKSIVNLRVKMALKGGIPTTVSALGGDIVAHQWVRDGYKDLEKLRRKKHLLINNKEMEFGGDRERLDRTLKMSYKGGRNECFAYGVLQTTPLYDYDLKNAYTTGLATVGAPDWKRVIEIKEERVLKEYVNEGYLKNGYVVAELNFIFPPGTKFPNLPSLVNNDLLCYPLEGTTVIGGPEISAALSRGAEITKLKAAYYIPFREDDYKPFFKPIRILQEERKQHPGGSVENHVLKLILNSIYGQTASGINPKVRYNTATGETEQGFFRSILSCPFSASYTTSLIRGVIAEQLYKLEELGHMILSVTTDG